MFFASINYLIASNINIKVCKIFNFTKTQFEINSTQLNYIQFDYSNDYDHEKLVDLDLPQFTNVLGQ